MMTLMEHLLKKTITRIPPGSVLDNYYFIICADDANLETTTEIVINKTKYACAGYKINMELNLINH